MLNLEEGLTVLSLFDGMASGMIALQRAGIKVKAYYASEIDKPAMKVAKHNWPDIIHIGDVTKVFYAEGWLFTENGNFYVGKIDLLIGGSPCQGFSFAGKQLNFEDPRSKLFFEYVRLREETQCEYFFLENVMMKQEYQDIISEKLNINPIRINSAVISAGNRKRLYWTNINGHNPLKERNLVLADILEYDVCSKYIVSDLAYKRANSKHPNYRPKFDPEKSGTLNLKNNSAQLSMDAGTSFISVQKISDRLFLSEKEYERAIKKYKAKTWKSGNSMGNMQFPNDVNKKAKALDTSQGKGNRETNHILDGDYYRRLTEIECERLQSVPDNYTEQSSSTQRYRMLGNGWHIDTIAHLFEPLLYAI